MFLFFSFFPLSRRYAALLTLRAAAFYSFTADGSRRLPCRTVSLLTVKRAPTSPRQVNGRPSPMSHESIRAEWGRWNVASGWDWAVVRRIGESSHGESSPSLPDVCYVMLDHSLPESRQTFHFLLPFFFSTVHFHVYLDIDHHYRQRRSRRYVCQHLRPSAISLLRQMLPLFSRPR